MLVILDNWACPGCNIWRTISSRNSFKKRVSLRVTNASEWPNNYKWIPFLPLGTQKWKGTPIVYPGAVLRAQDSERMRCKSSVMAETKSSDEKICIFNDGNKSNCGVYKNKLCMLGHCPIYRTLLSCFDILDTANIWNQHHLNYLPYYFLTCPTIFNSTIFQFI